jgi:hypothetical protein
VELAACVEHLPPVRDGALGERQPASGLRSTRPLQGLQGLFRARRQGTTAGPVAMRLGSYCWAMALRARVHRGRLILDEPTNLPEGTVVDLAMDDEGDDLTPTERKRLETQLRRAWADAGRGRVRAASVVLRELRRGRR